jgi:Ca2+-binding EF-hand superfamily protein
MKNIFAEKNRITVEVFADVDRNNDHTINFKEFVVSTWKYVVKGKSDLAGFAFDIFDTDNSEFLTEDEVVDLIAELYGTKHLEQDVAKLIRKMDKSHDGRINRKEFIIGCKNYPQLLYPAFSLQEALRTKVCGPKFWDQKAESAAR